MRCAFLLAFLCLAPAMAADHWARYASGPFEVLTDAGEKAGQETMVRFEEFRHALGTIVGEQDLETPQPVRILVFKNPQGWTSSTPISMGRDRYAIVLAEKATVGPDVYRELTKLLLNSNLNRLPPAFEHGLVEFFSTYDVHGIHIAVGAPPAHPDLDWARVDMLVLQPEYFGKVRILLYNLRKGVDEDAACQNAFGKSAAEIEALAKRYFAAGNFQTGTISSLPMAPGDFHERPISDTDVRLVRADLLAGEQSATEYRSLLNDHLKVPEAEEGLGLLALRAHRNDEARGYFAAAMEAGSTSARAYIEYARLESDDEKADKALLRAAGINSKLAEPFAMMAQRDTDPQKRLAHWKAAAERDPRNASYWQALAESYLAGHDFADAGKAWREAEQASTDPAQRDRMRQARIAVEGQRLDYEAAEKRRQQEEDARELQRLKSQAQEHLHEVEAKYNGSEKPVADAVPWSAFPHPQGEVSGVLEKVDCLGKQARMVIAGDDHKVIKLLITDPGKIAISGTGEAQLGCGVQKPRRVTVQYFPKADARLATAGEVATIEFR